ncbi:carboxymuconolactone decarboxylase [Colletotrichum truncatum]|uniref:Carboxymuconolactone decarboxylase n=1 Tax=Colletotrichum truncatum TaxID=5467 RepID=A0ACC3YVC5_COLTU|nr:carboxymuconolactone decarboxylase [Colletotrichum truncatum]KAF6781192.1 carboxymuconolactone decarboxylase [Colletotrichum truncatum]
MSQPSEKFILGAQMSQQFLGEKLFEEIRQHSRDDLPSNVGSTYIAEVCFSSYARPELTFRDRSLMNIGILIALNRPPELRIHIRAALHNGISREQITEACRHAMIYCGVPAGRDALGIASDIFNQMDKAEKMTESAKLS